MHSGCASHFLIAALLLLSGANSSAQTAKPSALQRSTSVAWYWRDAWLDVNRVKLSVSNRGGWNYWEGTGGGYWPNGGGSNIILFDFGPCVVGKVGSNLGAAIAQWGSSYSPGPIINGKAAMVAARQDSQLYRVFRISQGEIQETNLDYSDWPVSLGAPVDGQGKPLLFGNQTLWTQYNNLDTSERYFDWIQNLQPSERLPLEIHQTIYAHAAPGGDTTALLANVAFMEWTIINKGNVTIDSAFFSLWSDIDFNLEYGNSPAVDTLNQLGYCWQSSSPVNGAVINESARAVGLALLYGPTVPSAGNTATFRGYARADARNLPLTSFWGIFGDGPDTSFYTPAQSITTTWNIARGFDKFGNPIIDSVTHQVTKFPYSGDPISNSGWVWQKFGGGHVSSNMFSGPFTMAPNDTQWVMAALIPASSSDRFSAIYYLREKAKALRSMTYSALADTTYTPPPPPPLPEDAELLQNYPNPFNSLTVIFFTVPATGFHTLGSGSVQIPNASDVRLVVYDILGREVTVLVDDKRVPGLYEVSFDGTGLASGPYFYRLETAGQVEVKRMMLVK